MPSPRRVSVEALRRILMSDGEVVGVFEEALGFRGSTYAVKGVHVMNDLAQCVLGGAPAHEGDYLCRIFRFDAEGEDHREATLRADARFGGAFSRAFPPALGAERIESLRLAARTVLNFDNGVYAPGNRMASSLATHRGLLGAEQFRRFRIGAYLAWALPEEGKARLRDLFLDESDPVSRAFRPLLLPETLVDKQRAGWTPPRSALDDALGAGLTTLLAQPFSKPALLRAFALGASLGLVLKIFGVGFPGGRPVLLALADQEAPGPRNLRSEAVASLRQGQAAFDRLLARMIPRHGHAALLAQKPGAKDAAVEVPGGRDREALALDAIEAARSLSGPDSGIYWPDQFAIALGRKTGCVLPLRDQAGWGRHLALSSEHVEVLLLMHVARGAPPKPWRSVWKEIREGLGVVVGANPTADAAALAGVGVENVSVERLSDNAESLLSQAVRRGVARRLPDGGAEAGGELR